MAKTIDAGVERRTQLIPELPSANQADDLNAANLDITGKISDSTGSHAAEREGRGWIDWLMVLFLAGLAVLPPIQEIHKQLILILIAAVQLLEGRLVRYFPRSGRYYAVLLKIALATL